MKLTLEVDDSLMVKVMDITGAKDPQASVKTSLYGAPAKDFIERKVRTGEAFLFKPAAPDSPMLFEEISFDELNAQRAVRETRGRVALCEWRKLRAKARLGRHYAWGREGGAFCKGP